MLFNIQTFSIMLFMDKKINEFRKVFFKIADKWTRLVSKQMSIVVAHGNTYRFSAFLFFKGNKCLKSNLHTLCLYL